MKSKRYTLPLTSGRGPIEHERRGQILEAARVHFRDYGYAKTTVADLASAIGVSAAYIYRFFDSKKSIGEAICAQTLGGIAARLTALADEPVSATDKMGRFYRLLLDSGYDLLIKQRRMHDLVACSVIERWESGTRYRLAIAEALRRIIIEGRNAGEFEAETPVNDVVHALAQAAVPFAHPTILEQRELKDLRESAAAVTAMVIRSLRVHTNT